MSRLISDILDADRVGFKHLIDDWERRSGKQGHDLRLYSDVRSKAVDAVKILGLDPTDTISGELYFALQEKARDDNVWLADVLKVSVNDKPEDVVKKCLKWVTKNSKHLDAWVCKQAPIKSLLKKYQPKILMKTLGLRSVDSMLKRNSVAEVLTLAYEVESDDWVEKFHQNYKKFNISNFDQEKISFGVVEKDRIQKLEKAGVNVTKVVLPNYELASVLIVPPKNRFPLDVLAIVAVLSETLADIRKHGAYFRMLSVRKDFGHQFYELTTKGILGASGNISEIGWNSIHKHLVGNEEFMSQIEQPYISHDEFTTLPAINLLAEYDPRFKFWENLEYVFYHNHSHQPVSFNLIDVVTNTTNSTPHHEAKNIYGKSRLWEELWLRYLSHDNVAEDIIDKFLQN